MEILFRAAVSPGVEVPPAGFHTPTARREESVPTARCPVCGLAASLAGQRRGVEREFSSRGLGCHPGIQRPNVMLVWQRGRCVSEFLSLLDPLGAR